MICIYEKLIVLGPKIWTKETSYILIAVYEKLYLSIYFYIVAELSCREAQQRFISGIKKIQEITNYDTNLWQRIRIKSRNV